MDSAMLMQAQQAQCVREQQVPHQAAMRVLALLSQPPNGSAPAAVQQRLGLQRPWQRPLAAQAWHSRCGGVWCPAAACRRCCLGHPCGTCRILFARCKARSRQQALEIRQVRLAVLLPCSSRVSRAYLDQGGGTTLRSTGRRLCTVVKALGPWQARATVRSLWHSGRRHLAWRCSAALDGLMR